MDEKHFLWCVNQKGSSVIYSANLKNCITWWWNSSESEMCCHLKRYGGTQTVAFSTALCLDFDYSRVISGGKTSASVSFSFLLPDFFK